MITKDKKRNNRLNWRAGRFLEPKIHDLRLMDRDGNGHAQSRRNQRIFSEEIVLKSGTGYVFRHVF